MKIAIFGLARSGLAALKFLVNHTNHEVFVINQGNPRSWENFSEVTKYISMDHCITQIAADELLASMDQIILSPGIAITNKTLQKALDNNIEIISEIELAFQYSNVPVIAITGTNGKTTTATMVAEVLKMSGKKVFLGGNIGIPYCEIFNDPYDLAVIEVSSFQLENIKTFKPHIAMLLNISENHAERYESIESYTKAKYELFKNMKKEDFVLLGEDLSKESIKANVSKIRDLSSFDFGKSKLVGNHNKKNFFCAWKVLEILKIPNRTQLMQDFINEFKGVNYRLQFIDQVGDTKFYNDAKSTNNNATVSAVKAFQESDEDLYLILGGKLRSDKVDILSSLIGLKIKEIFTIGEAAQKLQDNLSTHYKTLTFENLEELFKVFEIKKVKGVVLFSPAFPSFDQYDNYEKRGEHFNEMVEMLKEKTI